MKNAVPVKIVAIEFVCPDCGDPCQSCSTTAPTATFITESDKTVVCEQCGIECTVPTQAFVHRFRRERTIH